MWTSVLGTAVGNRRADLDTGRSERLMGDDLEARALRGDDRAWNELIGRYDRRVWSTVLALGAPPEAASEVTQETWIKLVQRARRGELSELRLPGLAITQARFIWLNRLDAAKPTVSTDDDDNPVILVDEQVDAFQRLSSAEELDKVMAALDAVPARTRSLMASVYDEGLTAAQAGARFGLSVQRVRQTLCEVRATLRATLGGRKGGGR